ncbi:hotdog fold thioesterase [Salinicola endophyticus]|uniref:Hotdog fold thioesterase n=1 Tax=Salinicola endophyticus TaxID=1949083 RepID=A0ABY8FMW6_9GAMM|nr:MULTISPECIES: hotdog fold thioesterase [Salinicola]WFF41229.1 hotdog fold thioesterase [Salinicola endophyticus]
MSIWKRSASLETLAAQCQQTLVAHIGIEFTELGDDCLRGRMPVDARTHQPYGLLHGGASVVLAETLGSIAANLCLADESKMAVGMEINANHVRAVRQGWVEGCARPLHLGSTTQLWEIRIEDERGRLVCVSRLTMAVVKAA